MGAVILSHGLRIDRMLLPFTVLAGGIGAVAWYFDVSVQPIPHQLLGFVLGFFLVIMGNLSNVNYQTAVHSMNSFVQDGTNLLSEVIAHLPCETVEDKNRILEFRRLVCLFHRLMCYEVRADIQVTEESDDYLDPNGACNADELIMFEFAVKNVKSNEWQYHHPKTAFKFLSSKDGYFKRAKINLMGILRLLFAPSWFSSGFLKA